MLLTSSPVEDQYDNCLRGLANWQNVRAISQLAEHHQFLWHGKAGQTCSKSLLKRGHIVAIMMTTGSTLLLPIGDDDRLTAEHTGHTGKEWGRLEVALVAEPRESDPSWALARWRRQAPLSALTRISKLCQVPKVQPLTRELQ